MVQIDMPMPEACDVCPFNYDFCWCNAFGDDDEWEKYRDDWNDHVCDRETRPGYCPLKEIVRCKDCINAEVLKWLDNAIICKKHSYTGVRPDEFYCADGERRDDP